MGPENHEPAAVGGCKFIVTATIENCRETTQAVNNSDHLTKKLGELEYTKLKNHMHDVAQRFKRRTEHYKEMAVRPLTPTTEELAALDKEVEEKRATRVLVRDDFTEKREDDGEILPRWKRAMNYVLLPHAIHPQSKLMLAMMTIQTLFFLYNAWVIPLRFSFHIYQAKDNLLTWALLDYLADAAYLVDMLVVKTRMMFLDSHGVFESDRRETIKNYIKSPVFKYDALSLLPLDIFYLATGFQGRAAILRLPRLLRSYNFTLFFDRLDAILPYPVIVRLSRTVNVMLYLIHIKACSFYLFSDLEGIDSSTFVFNGHGNAYIRCFYICLKTSVKVGMNAKPSRDSPWQMIFMGSLWLLGIFVFASLIGNVKDIIAQSSRKQDEYMFRFDRISQYMYHRNVPAATVERVKQWCQHTWRTQKSFDELAILEQLPTKLRTDVALDVHYGTVSGVKLFHGCDPSLIKDLVIRLQPIIFLPGDYICKKGDVGKEMFIITSGQVQVVGGPDDSIVFVTLGNGVCFGEIALLGSGNMNRRTANVRAFGFTTLYVLYKDDLTLALNDYPEDRELLAKKAKKAAKEVAAKQASEQNANSMGKDIIFPSSTPVLIQTVMTLIKSNRRKKKEEEEGMEMLGKFEERAPRDDLSDILVVETEIVVQ